MKKDFLKNFEKFTGKHLYQGLFFNKAAGLRPQPCNFIKRETLAQAFSWEFCEISKNNFFTEHLRTTAPAPTNTAQFFSKKLVSIYGEILGVYLWKSLFLVNLPAEEHFLGHSDLFSIRFVLRFLLYSSKYVPCKSCFPDSCIYDKIVL